MDTFDLHFFEVAIPVWAKHKVLIQFNLATYYRSTHDETKSFRHISVIDHKFSVDGIFCLNLLKFWLRERTNKLA
jgi:hypothetical protein